MEMTQSERIENLDTMIAEGRLIRHAWRGLERDDGRATACLLAALSPECGAEQSATACPAGVMPAWLAHLTPWFDDAGSAEAWPGMVRRYASLARRWGALDAEAWRRLDFVCRAVAVREARAHTSGAGVLAAIDAVLVLLDRAGEGGAVSGAEWREAAAEAAAAAWSAAAAAAAAAARAAAEARSAARSAAWAAAAAAAEAEARSAARSAAWSVAWSAARGAADRITAGMLDAIEAAIVSAEAPQ